MKKFIVLLSIFVILLHFASCGSFVAQVNVTVFISGTEDDSLQTGVIFSDPAYEFTVKDNMVSDLLDSLVKDNIIASYQMNEFFLQINDLTFFKSDDPDYMRGWVIYINGESGNTITSPLYDGDTIEFRYETFVFE